ncbi:hypothetical protein CYMTET_37474 [Cymbomonas tetramitiformis]|uniref:Uncharacterized protein n=1 Tax=Cymbomonas tetramitiformis TaxID=36881 RepID=A0AAE0F6E5_9CHLO|nr:hypothetical protein CYMTET_37474 [Cymbomonas tetramitiformis]
MPPISAVSECMLSAGGASCERRHGHPNASLERGEPDFCALPRCVSELENWHKRLEVSSFLRARAGEEKKKLDAACNPPPIATEWVFVCTARVPVITISSILAPAS